jgi:heme O synthase-like polyprenyltransferase
VDVSVAMMAGVLVSAKGAALVASLVWTGLGTVVSAGAAQALKIIAIDKNRMAIFFCIPNILYAS